MWQYQQTEMSRKKEFMYRDATNVEHVMYYYTGSDGPTGTVTKGLKKHLKAIPENIQYIRYKRQLYLEQHT